MLPLYGHIKLTRLSYFQMIYNKVTVMYNYPNAGQEGTLKVNVWIQAPPGESVKVKVTS